MTDNSTNLDDLTRVGTPVKKVIVKNKKKGSDETLKKVPKTKGKIARAAELLKGKLVFKVRADFTPGKDLSVCLAIQSRYSDPTKFNEFNRKLVKSFQIPDSLEKDQFYTLTLDEKGHGVFELIDPPNK